MSIDLGEFDYRRGGRQRLQEAWVLLEAEFFAGGVYLAGRAVEGLLRAVIWKHDPEIRMGRKFLEAGHDLRDLLKLVADLGVLGKEQDRDALSADIQYVGRLWYNNMRYTPTEKMKTHWWRVGEIRRGRTIKSAVQNYFQACSRIIKRCEAICAG